MAKKQENSNTRKYSDTTKKDSQNGKFRSEIPPKKPKPPVKGNKK